MDYLSNIWDYLWFFFTVMIFIGYLMALFSVITDLFRDRELGGGWKALWIVFLLFLPLLTMIVYLIARGRGMGARTQQQHDAQRAATEGYIREVSERSTPAGEIAQAKALLDAGAISAEEFEAVKRSALARL
ncbi:SHOCT domain-containing protein [Georgenia sunbinii]|uniref:SHOCT domain-containing protein n=1 Tax=Georgenia sunbinii TaxID=3117728 RepID=UPI002F262996